MWCFVIDEIVIVIATAITKKAEWVLEGYNPVVTTGTALYGKLWLHFCFPYSYLCFTTLPLQDNQDNAAKVTTLQSDSRLDK